jgi:hypothetical protein
MAAKMSGGVIATVLESLTVGAAGSYRRGETEATWNIFTGKTLQ